MRYLFGTILLVITFSVTGVCQNDSFVKCTTNPDNAYNRNSVLKKFANILNKSIPEYRKLDKLGFEVKNEKALGFFIYDLTDITNKQISFTDCIKFENNHIYHISPIYYPYSFSHIIVLEDGHLRVFRSVNCENKGDSLEDVICYLNKKLTNEINKEEIITRVKNYRNYGFYNRTDDFATLQCTETQN